MPVPIDTPFERAQLALANLLGGDPEAAGLAVVRGGEALSPAQRESIADRYLGKNRGPLSGVVDAITNPLVLAGLVLTVTYPIAPASKILKLGEKLQHYAKRHFPGMVWLKDFRQLFGDRLDSWFNSVIVATHDHKEIYSTYYKQAFEEYLKNSGKPWTKETGVRIASILDGLHKNSPVMGLLRKVGGYKGPALVPQALTHDETWLAAQIKAIQDKEFAVMGNARGPARPILSQLRAQGLITDEVAHLKDYFPHIETLTSKQLKDRYTEWVSGMSATGPRRVKGGRPVSQRLYGRRNAMLPSEDDLKAAGLWTDELAAAYGRIDSQFMEVGGAPARRYTLDLPKAYEHYVRSMAHTFAWHVPPPDAKHSVHEVVFGNTRWADVPEHLKLPGELSNIKASGNRLKARILEDTYIPLLAGRMTANQAFASMRFQQIKESTAELIDKLPGLSPGLRTKLREPLLSPSSFNFQKVGGEISSYLYSTTLGLNVVSPLKNMLQSLITTYPTIGAKYTAQGMKETLSRYSSYLGLRQKGVDAEHAFAKAFQEFAEADLDIGRSSAAEYFGELTRNPKVLVSKGRKAWDEFQRKSLILFTGSERFNRLSAFYGAHAKALAELPGTSYLDPFTEATTILQKGSEPLQAAASRFAATVTRMTQFGGGPLAAPYGISRWWPPLRQYLQFPLRVAGFAAGPGVRLGGEGGFNPGTLGRMLLASGVASEAASSLFDTDISGALMFGAMPQPGREHSPLGYFPLVSPFVQMVGATASAAIKGDLDELADVAQLGVPGGIEFARLSSAAAPGVAKALGRPYADYNSPTPDGRIPLYTAQSQLIGYYSPMQLWAKSVGIGDVSGTAEMALLRWFMTQRDTIRETRRRYIEALTSGNMEEVRALNEQWKKSYPGLGDITVKRSDIRAVQLRREVPRLERIMETLPAENRPAFAQVLSVYFGSQGPGFFGTDPRLFGDSTIRSRMPMRPYRPAVQLPVGASTGSGVAAREAGVSRRDELAPLGFEALNGYL